MDKTKYLTSRIGPISTSTRYVSVTEISMQCDVHPGFVDRLVHLGLLDPLRRGRDMEEWEFETDAVSLVRKIIRLRDELGINYAGVGVVLELLSRIEKLESRIRELEDQG